MATKKISELEAINAAEDNDVLVIVDTSESTTNKITKGNLLIGAGHTIEMTLNENYQIVLVLKNAAGTALSTQTIDLPNENAITNLAYNNGILTITKQSGATSQINLTGLIEGLVTESDFNTFKEALQTTLEAINEKDAEQDEAIAENYKVINKLNEKLENQQKVIDQLPQVEGQGTEVTLENTIEAQFTKFDVEGNSTQETTTGKNKVDVTSGTINIPSTLTLTQNADGTLTLNGNTGGTFYYAIQNMKFANIVNGNSYKLVTKVKSGTWNAGVSVIGMQFIDSNAQQIQTLQNSTSSQESKVINGDVNKVNLYLGGAFSATNLVIEIMLVEASVTDDSFEKFTYGASPNLNYKQPIYNAGDNENIIDINRTLGTPSNTGYDNTNKRTFDVTTLIKFLTANNYYNAGVQIDYSLIDNGIKITTKQAGYGIGFPVILSSAKTYTISANIDVIDNQMIRAIFYKEDGTYISNVTSSGTNKFLTFTTTDDTYFVVIMLTPKANVETTYSNIKLEKGNKASGYSPYGMGSINEKIQNKNFAWNNLGNTTLSGVTFTVNENKSITANGTATKDIYYVLRNDLSFKAGETWSLSGCNGGSSTTYELYCYYIGDLYNGSITKTLTSDFVNIQLGIIVRSGTTLNNVTFYPQLEKDLPTSYVPHEEQDYSIFVQKPMMDDDHFDRKNNKEVHTWIKYVLDGSNDENWSIRNNKFFIVDNINYSLWEKSISPKGKSNIGVISYSVLDDHTGYGLALAYGLRLNLENIDASNGGTIEQLRAYLAEHPITIYVKLKDSAYEKLPCTEEQIQQLENLPSTYKDFTIIQSQDETEAYLEVAGIYNLNKLITRTEILESES